MTLKFQGHRLTEYSFQLSPFYSSLTWGTSNHLHYLFGFSQLVILPTIFVNHTVSSLCVWKDILSQHTQSWIHVLLTGYYNTTLHRSPEYCLWVFPFSSFSISASFKFGELLVFLCSPSFLHRIYRKKSDVSSFDIEMERCWLYVILISRCHSCLAGKAKAGQ